jgi:hypothetical protein
MRKINFSHLLKIAITQSILQAFKVIPLIPERALLRQRTETQTERHQDQRTPWSEVHFHKKLFSQLGSKNFSKRKIRKENEKLKIRKRREKKTKKPVTSSSKKQEHKAHALPRFSLIEFIYFNENEKVLLISVSNERG